MEENNEELNKLAKEVGNSFDKLSNSIKNKSLNGIKENLRNAVKDMLRLVAKAIWKALKIILGFIITHFTVVIIAVCLIVIVFYSIFSLFGISINGSSDDTIDSDSSISSESTEMIQLDNSQKNYKIKKDYATNITNMLEEKQVDTEVMGFLNTENVTKSDGTTTKELKNMIDKYIEAQLYTMFPKIGSNERDGCILVERMSLNEDNQYESAQLEYMPWNTFKGKIESGEGEELINYFSLDPETFELCLVYTKTVKEYKEGSDEDSDENGYTLVSEKTTYELQKFDYQSGISRYATPVSFFIAMHLITQNVEYMNDLVELIMQNTEITISYVENPTVEYEYAEYSGVALVATYSQTLSTNEGTSQAVLALLTLVSELFTGKDIGISIDGIGSGVVDGLLGSLMNAGSDLIEAMKETDFDFDKIKKDNAKNENDVNIFEGMQSGTVTNKEKDTGVVDFKVADEMSDNVTVLDRKKIEKEDYDKSVNIELKPPLSKIISNHGFLYVTHAKTWLLQSELMIAQGARSVEGPTAYCQVYSGTKLDARYNGIAMQLKISAHLVLVREKLTEKAVSHELAIAETSSGYNVTEFIELLDKYPRVENNLMTAPSLLFELLEEDEKTQEIEKVMKYVLMLMTGNNYGVDQLEAFDTTEAISIGAKTATGLDISDMVDADELEDANDIQKKIVEVVNNYDVVGEAGQCYAWIRKVAARAGAKAVPASYARNAGYLYGVSTDFSYVPIGAAVYGLGGKNSEWGHCGIYIGKDKNGVGQVAHCIGSAFSGTVKGIKIEPLSEWIEKYRGKCWGWYSDQPVNSKYPITQGLMTKASGIIK